MASNAYNPNSADWTRPTQDAVVVSAGASQVTNTNGDNTPFRGIYVGVSGNVTVTHISGASVQYVGLAAGIIHPIAGTKITAATATSIVAVF